MKGEYRMLKQSMTSNFHFHSCLITYLIVLEKFKLPTVMGNITIFKLMYDKVEALIKVKGTKSNQISEWHVITGMCKNNISKIRK